MNFLRHILIFPGLYILFLLFESLHLLFRPQHGKTSQFICFLRAFCVSKLFERIILSRLLFFPVSHSILSFRQASIRSGWSTSDQTLYISRSNSSGFDKPKHGSRIILAASKFSIAFDSVWHPSFFQKLI